MATCANGRRSNRVSSSFRRSPKSLGMLARNHPDMTCLLALSHRQIAMDRERMLPWRDRPEADASPQSRRTSGNTCDKRVGAAAAWIFESILAEAPSD